MYLTRSALAACVLLAFCVSCGSKDSDEPPVAEVSAKFSRQKIALGSPVDITYRFAVAQGARFDQNYRVMAHFLDSDEELMWTDDHLPPVPTSQWKPGQVVEYTRTVFFPVYQYIGEATFNVGLYADTDQHRLPLAGENRGQRSYRVASIEILPQSENVYLIYKSGWHAKEVAPQDALVSWQWTRKAATITFRNPKRESVLYIHVDNPGKPFKDPQRIDVVLNEQRVDSFELAPGEELLHRTRLQAEQLGAGDIAELQLHVDKTYVPALLPASNSRDSRELGVRVFHVFVEPQAR
jgi:hypothetical protein